MRAPETDTGIGLYHLMKGAGALDHVKERDITLPPVNDTGESPLPKIGTDTIVVPIEAKAEVQVALCHPHPQYSPAIIDMEGTKGLSHPNVIDTTANILLAVDIALMLNPRTIQS